MQLISPRNVRYHISIVPSFCSNFYSILSLPLSISFSFLSAGQQSCKIKSFAKTWARTGENENNINGKNHELEAHVNDVDIVENG